jgi:hypothetical protein
VTISQDTETFFGKTVVQYEDDEDVDLSNNAVYRLSLDYDDERSMPDMIEQFLSKVDKNELDSLIIGMWGDPYEQGADDIIATLIAQAPQLPKLRALFIGDMTGEECEISWIIQGSYTPLLNAYPQLDTLKIRGANTLTIDPFTHASLRSLTIECGGLPAEVAAALAASTLPALEHLELWLGTDEYGFSGDVDLYRRVLDQLYSTKLTYLGLRDAEIADDLAVWLAGEPRIATLDTLDLSLGTLGDVGAEALFASQHVGSLKTLDLTHHYITAPWQEKLSHLPVKVLLGDEQEPDEDDDDYRYVAVGE